MTQVTAFDFLLFAFYAVLYFYFIRQRIKRSTDPVLGTYLKYAYWFRVIGCLLFSFFVLYLSPSDATAIFFPEAKNIYKQILQNPLKFDFLFRNWQEINSLTIDDSSNATYFSGANLIMIKLIVALNIFSLGNFITTSFLFSLLAFEGSWSLFRFFNSINPKLQKYTAFCFLFIPTFVFWTSGIVKESVSVFCLGFITLFLNRIIVLHKSILVGAAIIVALSVLLYNLKSYTIVTYAPVFLYFILKYHIAKSSAHQFIKYALNFIFIAVFTAGIVMFVNSNDKAVQKFQFDAISQTIESQQFQFNRQAEDAGSSFDLGIEFDPSVGGFIRAIPFAITAAFYRPFLWEVKKITSFISAIESLALLLITLYVFIKCRPIFFLGRIFNDPLILFCFLFAFIFGFFCGISTLNFGSLVRYKLPCMPFYVYALALIYLAKQKVYVRN